MRRIFSTKAFTLMELIIASLMMIVVIAGIYAVNSVLSNNNQDYGQRYLVKSETQATLNHIINNVALATGSGNNNDEAIFVGSLTSTQGLTDPNTFCIHQGPNNNITGSNSDIWLCYTYSNNQIHWCAEPYTAGNDPRGATTCSPSTVLVAGTSYTYLGTASANPAVTYTSSNSQLLFSVTIQNCLNNSASTCTSVVANQDPANNPVVTLSGSTIPLQTSM